MNSRVPTEKLHSCVDEVLREWSERPGPKRREKVQVLIGFKRRRSKRGLPRSANVKLKHAPKRFFRVCILGDEKHCKEAAAAGVAHRDIETILEMSKNIVKVRKLRSKFDAFLASPSVMSELPDPLLSVLNRADKSPVELTHEESLQTQIHKLKHSTKFEQTSAFRRVATIGNVKMKREMLADNVVGAVDRLVSLLVYEWGDVRYIDIKSDRGPHQRLY